MSDTEHTRYVDPDTWFERLYAEDTAADEGEAGTRIVGTRSASGQDGPAKGVHTMDTPGDADGEGTREVGTPGEDQDEPAVDEPEPEADGEDQGERAGPGRWWSKRTGTGEAERNQVRDSTKITVPGLPPYLVVAPEATAEGRRDRHVRAKLAARRRWALYNGTAAALGWSVGLLHHCDQWLQTAAQNPAGTASVLLAGAGGWTVWRATGRLHVLPYPYLVRPLAAAAVASYAAQSAPALVAWTIHHGIPTDPTMPICAGLGLACALYALDRRYTRHWWRPAAWVFRAPLAAACLALALYPTML